MMPKEGESTSSSGRGLGEEEGSSPPAGEEEVSPPSLVVGEVDMKPPPLVTIPENWDTIDLTKQEDFSPEEEEEESTCSGSSTTTNSCSSSSSSSSSCSHSEEYSSSSNSSSGSSSSSPDEDDGDDSSSSSCSSSQCRRRRCGKTLLSKKERDSRKGVLTPTQHVKKHPKSSANSSSEVKSGSSKAIGPSSTYRRTFDPGKKGAKKPWTNNDAVKVPQNAGAYRLNPGGQQIPSTSSYTPGGGESSHKENSLSAATTTSTTTAAQLAGHSQSDLTDGRKETPEGSASSSNIVTCGLQVIEDADLVAILKDVSEATSGSGGNATPSVIAPSSSSSSNILNSASTIAATARASNTSSSPGGGQLLLESRTSNNSGVGISTNEIGAKAADIRRVFKGSSSEESEEDIRRRRAAASEAGHGALILPPMAVKANKKSSSGSSLLHTVRTPPGPPLLLPNSSQQLSNKQVLPVPKVLLQPPPTTASNTILPATQASFARQRHNSNKKRKNLHSARQTSQHQQVLQQQQPADMELYLNSATSNVSPDSGIQSEGGLASGSPLHPIEQQVLPFTNTQILPQANSCSTSTNTGTQNLYQQPPFSQQTQQQTTTTLSWNGLYYNTSAGYQTQQPPQIIQGSQQPRLPPRHHHPQQQIQTYQYQSNIAAATGYVPTPSSSAAQQHQIPSRVYLTPAPPPVRESTTPPPPTLLPSVILPPKAAATAPKKTFHHHKKFSNVKTGRPSYVLPGNSSNNAPGAGRIFHQPGVTATAAAALPPQPPRKMTMECGSQTMESSLDKVAEQAPPPLFVGVKTKKNKKVSSNKGSDHPPMLKPEIFRPPLNPEVIVLESEEEAAGASSYNWSDDDRNNCQPPNLLSAAGEDIPPPKISSPGPPLNQTSTSPPKLSVVSTTLPPSPLPPSKKPKKKKKKDRSKSSSASRHSSPPVLQPPSLPRERISRKEDFDDKSSQQQQQRKAKSPGDKKGGKPSEEEGKSKAPTPQAAASEDPPSLFFNEGGPIPPVFSKTFTLSDPDMFWLSPKKKKKKKKDRHRVESPSIASESRQSSSDSSKTSAPLPLLHPVPSTKTMLEVLAETSKKGKPGRKKKPDNSSADKSSESMNNPDPKGGKGGNKVVVVGGGGGKLKKSWKSKYKNVIDPVFLEEVDAIIKELNDCHIQRRSCEPRSNNALPSVFKKQKFIVAGEQSKSKSKRGRPPKRQMVELGSNSGGGGVASPGTKDSKKTPPDSANEQRLPLKKRHHHNKVTAEDSESGHSSSSSALSPPLKKPSCHRVTPLPRRDPCLTALPSPPAVSSCSSGTLPKREKSLLLAPFSTSTTSTSGSSSAGSAKHIKKVCAVTPTVIKSLSEMSKRKQQIQPMQQQPKSSTTPATSSQERILYSDEEESRKKSSTGGIPPQERRLDLHFLPTESRRTGRKKKRKSDSLLRLRRKSRISQSTSEEEDLLPPPPMEVDEPPSLTNLFPPDVGSYSDPETHTKLLIPPRKGGSSAKHHNTSVSLNNFPLGRSSVKECSVRVHRLNLHELLARTPVFLSEFEKLKEERRRKEEQQPMEIEEQTPPPPLKRKKKKRRTNKTGFPINRKKVKKKPSSSSIGDDKKPRGRPPKKRDEEHEATTTQEQQKYPFRTHREYDAIPMNPGVPISLISEQKRILPQDGEAFISACKRSRFYEDVDDEIDCLSLLPLFAKNSSSVSESSSSEEVSDEQQRGRILQQRSVLTRTSTPAVKKPPIVPKAPGPALIDPTAKKYLNAGLFSDFFKSESPSNSSLSSDGTFKKSSNVYVPSEHPHGLLPPPYYCGRQLRKKVEDFELPYDLWWLQANKRLPERDVVATWNYKKIKNNVYVDIRVPQSKMTNHPCHCDDTSDCGDDCINRMTYTECDPRFCPTRDQCTNNAIQRHRISGGVERFMTQEKGWGVKTRSEIKKGTFIMEYVGEIVSEREFKQRMLNEYENDSHHYCLHLESGIVIDGHRMGGECRFVNHSCAPNCEMQKWSVNGLNRMALFALRDIDPHEELTYDYNFALFNPHEGQICRCGSEACRGVIGGRSQIVKNHHSTSGGAQCSSRRNSTSSSSKSDSRGRDRKKKVIGSKAASSSSVPKRKDNSSKRPPLESSASAMPALKPMTPYQKTYIRDHSVFLMRNYEKVRRARDCYLASSSSPPPPSSEEGAFSDRRGEATVEEKIQIAALSASRSMQTRRITGAIDDPNVNKVVKLTQMFREILSQLMTINDENGRPVADKFQSLPSKEGHPKYFERLSEPIDLSTIDKNVSVGAYTSPETFDRDMIRLFQNNLRFYGRFSSQGSASLLLSKHYNAIKADYCESLRELVTPEEAHCFRRREDIPRNPEDVIRCICGLYNDEGLMIQCEKCQAWQHCDCVGQGQGEDKFFCERCSSRPNVCLDIRLEPQPEYASPGENYYVSLQRDDLQVRVGDTVYVLRAFDSISSDQVANSEFNHGGVPHKMMSPLKGPSHQASSLSKGNYPTYKSVDPQCASPDDMDIFRIERLWVNHNGERFAFGHHYLRPHETFHEPSRKFFPNEVFRVPLYEVLPLDSIWRQCWVLDVPTFCKGRPVGALEEHVYICEYRVDKTARLFNKISKPKFSTCLKWFAFDAFEQRLKPFRTYTPHKVPEKWSKSGASTSTNPRSKSLEDESSSRSTSGFLSSKRKAKVAASCPGRSLTPMPPSGVKTIFKLGQRKVKLEATLNTLLKKIAPAGVKNLSHLLESDKQRLRNKKLPLLQS